MIADINRAFDALQDGPARSLLPTLTEVRLLTAASPPLDGEDALLGYAPIRDLAECGEEAAAFAETSLKELLANGLLHGWLTCQSQPCLVEGPWSQPADTGLLLDGDLMLDADRAAGPWIGVHIRHLGGRRWRVAMVVEFLAAAAHGAPALAERIAYLGRARDGDDELVLHYCRYWQCTAEGEAYTPSCRLQQIERRQKT